MRHQHQHRLIGLPDLPDSQRKEAREIVLAARERHGSTTKASEVIGVPKGTLSTIASGTCGAGKGVYLKLKEYERRVNAGHV